MHTEAQFTTAMERAVAKRGADFCYPRIQQNPGGFYIGGNIAAGQPTYSTPSGIATCLIGCAMQEAGMEVPSFTERAAANAVLMDKVPLEVALAARVAQIHQDFYKPWGEALAMYNTALVIQHETPHYYSISSGSMLYMKTAERLGIKVQGRHMGYYSEVVDLEELTKPIKAITEEISTLTESVMKTAEAMITVPKATEKVYPTSKGGIVANGGIISGGWVTPSEAIYSLSGKSLFTESPEPMYHWIGATKKEHALTA